MPYALPAGDVPVSDTWQGHKNRNPPSSEPGTDYACAYGTILVAAASGTIVDLKTSNGSATGRYVTIDLDDGRRTRYLHMSEIWVGVGQRVNQGDHVGKSGASANGSDWGVGAHVHVTLWATQSYSFCSTCTIDFQLYVGPATLEAHQRLAVASCNRRVEPSSQSALAGDPLTSGTIANMTGWIHGEAVEGNDLWYQGTSGNWFWSGGFQTPHNGNGLTDLNVAELAPHQRQVGPNSVNGRSDPSTVNPATQSLDAGTIADFQAWTHGEDVESNDVWYQGAHSGDWFWSGGFTDQSTSGLEEVVDPEPTPTPDPYNPRGLPEYEPVYPRAVIGLVAPLGDGERVDNNEQPGVQIIDRFIIHHTGESSDQLDYFSYKNGGSSCPWLYIRPVAGSDNLLAESIELIRPAQKPASTGPTWNWRSLAVEVLNIDEDPTWSIADACREEVAQAIAWLADFNGKTLDGVPVEFTIDREHVIQDSDTRATICPGPDMDIDWIIARAQEIWSDQPENEMETVIVPREQLENLMNAVTKIAAEVSVLLDGDGPTNYRRPNYRRTIRRLFGG